MAVTVYVYEQFVLDPQGVVVCNEVVEPDMNPGPTASSTRSTNVRPKLLMNRPSEP